MMGINRILVEVPLHITCFQNLLILHLSRPWAKLGGVGIVGLNPDLSGFSRGAHSDISGVRDLDSLCGVKALPPCNLSRIKLKMPSESSLSVTKSPW